MQSRTRSRVAGKIAVITGASSGIGEVTALEFGRAGATVILAARRAVRLEAVAASITAAGGSALSVPTDLTDLSQITNLVQTTLRRFGRIDVLANIAGWGHYDWFEELTAERLRQHFEVNILGMAELTRQVLPTMKSQRSGIILNMSSYASRIAVPPLTVYASTKYAVEGLSDALRRELKPWGIRVIRVHPSAVTGTEFNHRAAQDGGIRYRSFPIGRVPRESVARALLRVLERPHAALFIGRVYDFAMVANWLFPWLVDWVSSAWVRSMRKKELTS